MTPAGEQASRIMDWAYEDPAGRSAEALKRAGDLYGTLSGERERNEVGDVVTQLSRLASSTVTMPSGAVSITGQVR